MAINSPLLAEVSLSGAKSVLVNITSSSNLGLLEMTEASQMIEEEAHEEVNLIWGWIVDETMEDDVRVTVIATDFQDGWQGQNPATTTRTTQTTTTTTTKDGKIPRHLLLLRPAKKQAQVDTIFLLSLRRIDHGVCGIKKTGSIPVFCCVEDVS
jgi:hypothetical protein